MFSFSLFAKPVTHYSATLAAMAGTLVKNDTVSGSYGHQESWLDYAILIAIAGVGLAGISAVCYLERKKLCGTNKELSRVTESVDVELGEAKYQSLAGSEDEARPQSFRV